MAAAGGEGVEKLEDMIVRAAETTSQHVAAAKAAIGNVIFGQEAVVERTLITVLCGGHGMLVGVPGLAKTKLVEALGTVLGLDARRIQFTPDLMPSDILGSEVLEEIPGGKRSFRFIPGPVFCQLLMADEINRASPRTQSALLQAMQEQRVSVAGQTHQLPLPFHVLATQNPLEQEGTYPLPEAQVDRFMFKVILDYPNEADERKILDRMAFTSPEQPVNPVVSLEEILATRKLVDQIHVDDKIRDYIVKIVFATRKPQDFKLDLKHYIQFGASPRATIFLTLAAKAWALLQGRDYVIPEDVKSIGPDVLRHRIILTYEAEAQAVTTDAIIKQVFNAVPVP